MTKKGLKVVHVSSEVEPFSKSGGLASVASALPKAQSILGHDVLVITPFYEKLINRKDFGLEEIGSDVLEISGKTYEVSYLKGYLNDKTPIFFITWRNSSTRGVTTPRTGCSVAKLPGILIASYLMNFISSLPHRSFLWSMLS